MPTTEDFFSLPNQQPTPQGQQNYAGDGNYYTGFYPKQPNPQINIPKQEQPRTVNNIVNNIDIEKQPNPQEIVRDNLQQLQQQQINGQRPVGVAQPTPSKATKKTKAKNPVLIILSFFLTSEEYNKLLKYSYINPNKVEEYLNTILGVAYTNQQTNM